MNSLSRRAVSLLVTLLVVLSSSLAFAVPSFAADEAYINSLVAKGFPRNYAVKLAVVHAKHPLWEFQPMKVNLDWDYVVSEESKPKVCTVFVSSGSGATRLFADRSLGTNTPSNGLDYTYVIRDVGTGGYYVDASDMCVATFMNPLNFIDDDIAILMFEHLGWGDLVYADAVIDVETMLTGSFMSKTRNSNNTNFVSDDGKIKYVNTEGKVVGTSVTFAEAITTAAQKNGVNPFFLCSRILGEMGYAGKSGSVTGTVSGYTGYYNYMNVGATDSSTGDAVRNGLATAKKNGWTSPILAIEGGAATIADGYIKAGQDTQYLQKFNVKTNSITTYHQYMTAINGAHFMLKTSYDNYKATGTLENKKVFKIPVYNNMPDGTGKRIYLNGYSTNATVASKATIRQQPNYNATSTTLPSNIVLRAGIRGTGSMSTTATALYCAMWYETTNSSGALTYVIEDYVQPAATLNVAKGKTIQFNTKQDSGSTEKPRYFSWDTRVATVNSSGVVTGVAVGTTKVVAYLANGSFAVINVNVTSGGSSSVPSSATSGTYSVNNNASFISKISVGTTVDQLLAGINERKYITVIKNGTAITGSTPVSTGCVVQIKDGSTVVKSYTVIVTGDINGDGNVTAADSLGIRDQILGASQLDAVRFKAADINGDGKITAADSLGVRDHILGVSRIVPKAY